MRGLRKRHGRSLRSLFGLDRDYWAAIEGSRVYATGNSKARVKVVAMENGATSPTLRRVTFAQHERIAELGYNGGDVYWHTIRDGGPSDKEYAERAPRPAREETQEDDE
ncbi:MAG: hypothetical protein ACHQQR_13205 [Gemmatimonadales bacterium]